MRKRSAGMFQPQSTPLDIFTSYGAPPTQNGFDFSSPSSGFALNGGGPIVFNNPTFGAVGDFRSLQANTAGNLAHDNIRRTTFGGPRETMDSGYEDEYAAQQAAAREYAPNLEARIRDYLDACKADCYRRVPLWGRRSHAWPSQQNMPKVTQSTSPRQL